MLTETTQDTTQERRPICGLCQKDYDACTPETGCGRHTLEALSISALTIMQAALKRVPQEERQERAKTLSEVFQ